MDGRAAQLYLSRGFLEDKDKSKKGEVCIACKGHKNPVTQSLSHVLKQNVTGDTLVHPQTLNRFHSRVLVWKQLHTTT